MGVKVCEQSVGATISDDELQISTKVIVCILISFPGLDAPEIADIFSISKYIDTNIKSPLYADSAMHYTAEKGF